MKTKIIRLISFLIIGNLLLFFAGTYLFNEIDFATSVIPGWHTTFVIIPNLLLYILAFFDSIILRIFFRISKNVRRWNLILLIIIPFMLCLYPPEFIEPEEALSPNIDEKVQRQFLIDLGICLLIITAVFVLVIDIMKNIGNSEKDV